MRGHSVAACGAVMCDCEPKFGSLKPSRYFAPFGICFSIVAGSGVPPQIIGTNSTPVVGYGVATPLSGLVVQFYHHPLPSPTPPTSPRAFLLPPPPPPHPAL